MNYTETEIFRAQLSNIESKINLLEEERIRIKSILKKMRTEREQKRFESIPARLKTQKGKLERLLKLDCPKWDLIHLIQAADRTLWNNQYQIDAWSKDLAAHEGRGEASLRNWYGLVARAASTEPVDLPEINVEIKNIQGKRADGKFQPQTIQAGKDGRKAYTRWMMQAAEAQLFKNLPEHVRDAIGEGEVSQGIIFGLLPPAVRDSLLDAVKASVVFSNHEAIDCATRNGFLHITNPDFDLAWSFQCITKAGPKYALRGSYLQDRLLRTKSQPESIESIHLRMLKERAQSVISNPSEVRSAA